jgi:hypothetical protein
VRELPSSLYWTEFLGHASTTGAGSLATLITAIFTGVMSNSTNDIAKAASAVIGEWPVALASTMLLIVPSIFSAIGVYAIVEANTDLLRYEAAVLTSQGVKRSTLIRVWLLLLAAIPALAYVLGLLSFLQFSIPRTDIGSVAIAGPIFLTSLTVLTLTYLKITSIMNSVPFGTLRQP